MPALRPRRRSPSTASPTGRAPTRTSQRTTRPPSRPSRRTSRSRRVLSTCGEGRSASPTRSSWRGPTTCVTARSCAASRRSSTTARPASGPTRWGSGECLTSASTRWATPSPTTRPSPTATSDRPTKTGRTPSSPWSMAAASRSARTSSRRWPRKRDFRTTPPSTPPASTRRHGCATSRPRWRPGSASTQAYCADSGVRLLGRNPSLLSAALLVALFAALLAGIVTGLTGFGLALISTPILLFVYEPRTVIVLTAIFSIVINSAVVWDSWQEARKRLALALLIPALFGIVAGVEVLSVINPDYVRLGVGVIVIFSALLLVRDIRLPGAGTRWGTLVAGSASGALSTSTGLAGPPVVLLLASRGLPKHEFRGTSALYFLPMSVVGILVLALRGLVEGGEVPLGLLLVPAAIAGKVIGTALLKRVSEKAFRAVTLGLVILTGTLGIATAVWALL